MISIKSIMKKALSFTTIIASILSFTLMTGCNNESKQSSVSTGLTNNYQTYGEKQVIINFPDNYQIINIFYDANRKLNLLVGDTKNFSIYRDGIKGDCEWLNTAFPENDKLAEAFFGQDGELYAFVGKDCRATNENEKDELPYFLLKASKDRKSYEDITPSKWKEKYEITDSYSAFPMIKKAMVCKNGQIVYINLLTNELVLDDNGKYTTLANKASDFTVSGDTLYYCDLENGQICKYNLTSNQLIESTPIDFITEKTCLSVNDSAVYALNEKGVFKKSTDGTIWENIYDSNSKKMSFAAFNANNFEMEKNENFYVLYYNSSENQNQLFLYTLGDVSEPENTKAISIYSMHTSERIQEAILKYNKLHPEIIINYYVADEDTSSATTSEKIKVLNTEILSGNGADIICLDGLPADSYVEKGVLEDLSDVLNPMVDSGELLSNITKNYVKDGKIYYMPMEFGLPSYVADNDTIDADTSSSKAMAQLADKFSKTDKRLFIDGDVDNKTVTSKRMMTLFTSAYYKEFINEDGSIDKDKYKAFLENVNTVLQGDKGGKKYYCAYEDYMNETYKQVVIGDALIPSNVDVHAAVIVSSKLYIDDDILMILTFGKEIAELNVKNFNNTFIPNTTLGLNSQSKVKDEAKDFIKYLFSEDIQKITTFGGYPVNANVVNEQLDRDSLPVNFFPSVSYCTEDGEEKEYSITWSDQETRDKWRNAILSAETPTYSNRIVMDMLYENAVDYFDGKITLDEAVDNTMKSVNMYLSE